MKRIRKISALILITSLVLSMQVIPSYGGSDAAQENRNPVKAENVEIVKKATIKGTPQKPAKTTVTAATGIIGATVTGTRYAVVIGISDYPGSSSDLSYGDDDALAVKSVLMEQYGFSAGNITLLTDSEATRSNIFAAVDTYKALLESGDELVFFFSGHGAKGRADDYDRSNVDQSIVVWRGADDAAGFDYIWDGELKRQFEGFNDGSRIAFIFDSCLSGGMNVLKSTNRVVNMACTANGLSYKGSWGGGHGQFTYYFMMEGLGLLKADSSDADSTVSIEEAFDYSKSKCSSQTPTIADGFTNDMLP